MFLLEIEIIIIQFLAFISWNVSESKLKDLLGSLNLPVPNFEFSKITKILFVEGLLTKFSNYPFIDAPSSIPAPILDFKLSNFQISAQNWK
jgi:hypothetical protein